MPRTDDTPQVNHYIAERLHLVTSTKPTERLEDYPLAQLSGWSEIGCHDYTGGQWREVIRARESARSAAALRRANLGLVRGRHA